MVTESACQACGRGAASPGYLVVERAYWYPDEPDFVANAGPWPARVGAAQHTHALPAAHTEHFANSAPRLRLAVSPAANALAVEQFCDALAARPAVRGVELEQFVGAMAVLTVDAIGLPDVVAALLELDGYPMVGLTVSGDGQISLRLDEHALAGRTAPAIQRAVQTTSSVTQSAGSPLSALQARVERLSRDLSAIAANAPVARPVDTAPRPPVIEYVPSAGSWQPQEIAASEAPTAVGPHIARALDRLAALRADAGLEAAPSDEPRDALAVAPDDEPRNLPGAAPSDEPHNLLGAAPNDEPQDAPEATPNGDLAVPLALEAIDDAVDDAPLQPAIFATPLGRDRAPTPFPRLTPSPVDEAESDEADETEPIASASPWSAIETTTSTFTAQSSTSGAPQSVQVIAYPFENFSGVNSFINAVRLLPDVRYVAPRRFRAGTIQLAVDYAGEEPLAERLRSLASFTPRIVSEDEESVTITIGNAS